MNYLQVVQDFVRTPSVADTDVLQVAAFFDQHEDAEDLLMESDVCFVWLWERRTSSKKGSGADCLRAAIADLKRRFRKLRIVVMDVKPAQFIKWTDDIDYPQVELAKQEAIDAVLWHIENLDLPSIVKGEVRPIMNNRESDSHAALQVVGSSMIASTMQRGDPEDPDEEALEEILFGTPDQSFHMVCGIWITPEFSKFQQGKTPPPTVCHATTDFEALFHSIQALFSHGPPVAFQIPNDTIDIVTIEVRSQLPEATADFRFCRDFAAALLRMAKIDTSDVLDIRSAWEAMHALPQRDTSPPPVLIMFTITAASFEDAMIWLSGADMSFGLRPVNPFYSGDDEDDQQAILPPNFHTALEAVFGCAFERTCIFDRICSDPPPTAFQLH